MRPSSCWRALIMMALIICSSGCVFFKKPRIPMEKETFASARPSAKHLILFLPGLGDSPKDVVAGGLVEEMKAAPQFDCIVADAHFGYYRTGVMTERLHEDVVKEIRPKYDEFWIAGTSMGGYGALAYAEKYPESVTGLVLLAPYLGQGKVLADIEKAGSLEKWDPSGFKTKNSRTAHGVSLWAFLKRHAPTADDPIIILGSGDRDKLKRGRYLLQATLPDANTRIVEGAHDWPTWRTLFHDVVARELSPR